MSDLKGKVAVVTGASERIGAAIAKSLSAGVLQLSHPLTWGGSGQGMRFIRA